MPVKVDMSRGCSPLPFDSCELLSELEQNLVNDGCLVNFDDMWENLIPTPPASPHVKFSDFVEMASSLDGLLDDADLDIDDAALMDQNLINHDCMWSGNGCNNGRCPSTLNRSIGNFSASSSWASQLDTSLNLSTSPINSFNDFALYDLAGTLNEALHSNFGLTEAEVLATAQAVAAQSTGSIVEHQQQQQIVEGNVYAMANDHSYESSSPVSIKIESEDESCTPMESSLINKNPVKILNSGKITKIKCKKIAHNGSKNSNSILNNSVTRSAAASIKTEFKSETSVLKPTIISVSNFKNLPMSSTTTSKTNDSAADSKYKVAIKKKKINIIDSKSSGNGGNTFGRQLIQIKKVPSSSSSSASSFSGNRNHHHHHYHNNHNSYNHLNHNHHHHQHITPLISPSVSDSEESSVVSFGSASGDDSRNGVNHHHKTSSSPPFRRREHNDSERKRRDHLRNSFNNLKDQIPKLQTAEKRPPRIMILHEATTYVTQLIETNHTLERTLQAENEKRKRLLNMIKKMELANAVAADKS